jgi:hypothetical protein
MSAIADLDLLRRLDDPSDPESPAGFDWRIADAALHAMAQDLAAALALPDLEVEGAEYIQDASFHGQIVLPVSTLLPGHTGPVLLCTSNFGGLAAMRPESALKPEVSSVVRGILAAHNYVYVPAALLEEPYIGAATLERRAPTWWDRYFEYL